MQTHDEHTTPLPKRSVDRLLRPLQHFLHVEASSGVVLFLCSVAALLLANSPWAGSFLGFWDLHTGVVIGDYELSHSLKHWVNDGLMVIFFFVIGLEVKREIALGELRELRRAALPLVAALGGMVVPAGIYLALQHGAAGERGWGIPMATDIAFVVGCMAVLGRRIPAQLRVMLLSLAIVDDIGAILVIALGYTETVHLWWLAMGIAGIGIVLIMQRLAVRSFGVYTLLGILIWVGFHESGIHATIAGVLLGLLTPPRPYLGASAGAVLLERASALLHGEQWETQPQRAADLRRHLRITRETVSPLDYLIHVLHPWVAFVIMPLFALANAGVPVAAGDLVSPVALAVMLGLLVGKPLGIALMVWLSLQLRIVSLPAGVRWRQIIGGGFLAGIGFTMALFIAALALDGELLTSAKVGVLAGSVISAIVGMAILASAPAEPAASPS